MNHVNVMCRRQCSGQGARRVKERIGMVHKTDELGRLRMPPPGIMQAARTSAGVDERSAMA